jgi:hypothetical protein
VRESSRRVCVGLVAALRAYGCPEQILTDIQAGCRLEGPRIVRPAV